MIEDERLNQELNRLGLDLKDKVPDDIRKIHAELEKGALRYVTLFIENIKKLHRKLHGDDPLTSEKIKDIAKKMWASRPTALEPMTRKVFDQFIRVAESKLLPGVKEGHFRTPSLNDYLAGKSGDPFQDLMMTLFNEAQERKRKK